MDKGETSVNNAIPSTTGNLCDLINYISIPSGFVVKAGMKLNFSIKMQQEKGTCLPRYTHYVSHNWKILVAVSSINIFALP